MHNTHKSIEGFARASFNQALMRGWPLHVWTMTLILKAYDGYFQDIYKKKFKKPFDAKQLTDEHRLIDDILAWAQMARRLALGVQELRRRPAERHCGAGVRFASTDGERAAVDGQHDDGERGGAESPATIASIGRARKRRSIRYPRSSLGCGGLV
jgi:hypothetical protein